MRVTLLHNPTAGDAKHSKEQLITALAKAGHQVTYQSTKGRGFGEALRQPSDLVLAAGESPGRVRRFIWTTNFAARRKRTRNRPPKSKSL